MALVLKWAWRHSALEVQEFDTLENAVRNAAACFDQELESLISFEVWDNDGTFSLLEGRAAERLVFDQLDRWDAERKTAQAESPPVVASVWITAPNDAHERACYGAYRSEGKAQQVAQRLRQMLGAERVELRLKKDVK